MKSFVRSLLSFHPLAVLVVVLGAGGLFAAALSNRGLGESALSAPAERAPVPDFVMTTLAGKEWRQSEHAGRVLVVNIFATWCPPCRAEMPMLVKTAEAYRSKGVDFVGVSLDEGGPEVVKPFVERYEMDFPVVFPGAGPSIADGIRGIPFTLVIDHQGRLARTYSGMVSEAQLTRDLDQLIAEISDDKS